MNKISRAKVLNDPKIEAVLARLYQQSDRQFGSLLLHYLPQLPNLLLGKGFKWDRTKTDFYRDKYIPIEPEQGKWLYLTARAIDAQNIVEFGTSYGISTIYLATAVRDNGGGKVISTEIVPEKIIQARKNIAAAGLESYVEIREGDALETLRDLNISLDLILIDGWGHLALNVLKILDPSIRQGGVVICDNVGTFKQEMLPYIEFMQNPDNGYCSTTIDLKSGTEFSVKVALK
ncbi:MAG: tRNA (adenine(22)-N(1))-methyltransferase TrmK [Pleurocapsa sp. MO_226.B13]|nr:tRNA (adenine(22)-N(1))-methyltransferase TrmK [Pleurocapsa sp. MO_226.B13]